MKIISWNVNGLRSAEEHFLKFINSEQPDLLLLQEIRAHPNQLSFFLKFIPGYKVEFNPSGRPGYGGTAVYYKETLSLDKLSSSVGNKFLDSEGRSVFCKLKNLSIFNFYVPNGNRNKERLDYKTNFYMSMEDCAIELLKENVPVIIGGHYTWWHLRDPRRDKNMGWRYDYFLVSKNIESKVRRSEMLKNVFGSDHCPIVCEIEDAL